MTEFNRYETITLELARKDKKYMERTTSCLYPCEYTQYKVCKEKVFMLLNYAPYVEYLLSFGYNR